MHLFLQCTRRLNSRKTSRMLNHHPIEKRFHEILIKMTMSLKEKWMFIIYLYINYINIHTKYIKFFCYIGFRNNLLFLLFNGSNFFINIVFRKNLQTRLIVWTRDFSLLKDHFLIFCQWILFTLNKMSPKVAQVFGGTSNERENEIASHDESRQKICDKDDKNFTLLFTSVFSERLLLRIKIVFEIP